MDETGYSLGFSLFPGIGPALFGKLTKRFGNARRAWESSQEDLKRILGEKIAGELVAFRKTIDLQKEYEKLVQKSIQLIALEDKAYPELLRKIFRPPFLLYVKGDISILSSPKTIGIVGTRKVTQYGKEVTGMLTAELVVQKFVTVSGLALGVDGIAHMTTIENGGKTIAVLGCGVDCCTPRENQKIYDAILQSGGAIVSAFPPGMKATKGSFPARNAIIAGLSLGVLVTEGAADSGSLITAKDAKKFGRPVFAVPGPITSSLSKGANSLIQKGAIPVMTAADILDSLAIMGTYKFERTKKKKASDISNNPDEVRILQLLEIGPLHFDEIVRTIGKDSKSIGSFLSLMELKGMITSDSGYYSLLS